MIIEYHKDGTTKKVNSITWDEDVAYYDTMNNILYRSLNWNFEDIFSYPVSMTITSEGGNKKEIVRPTVNKKDKTFSYKPLFPRDHITVTLYDEDEPK